MENKTKVEEYRPQQTTTRDSLQFYLAVQGSFVFLVASFSR